MTDDELNRMPWTRHLMSEAERREWLASRKTAGAAIDIATCERGRWAIDDGDLYGCEPARCVGQVGNDDFVRGPDSRGWVHLADLPAESIAAFYDRFHSAA